MTRSETATVRLLRIFLEKLANSPQLSKRHSLRRASRLGETSEISSARHEQDLHVHGETRYWAFLISCSAIPFRIVLPSRYMIDSVHVHINTSSVFVLFYMHTCVESL